MFHQYIRRNRHGKTVKIGVMVGTIVKIDDKYVRAVGWSLCSKRDVFDQHRAIEMAEGRALSSIFDKKTEMIFCHTESDSLICRTVKSKYGVPASIIRPFLKFCCRTISAYDGANTPTYLLAYFAENTGKKVDGNFRVPPMARPCSE